MPTIKRNDLPIGHTVFSTIREEGYVYVDKTDMVWQLANNSGKYLFLSRPRRFGKSMLVNTLVSYFEGRRDLFEGLKIMEIETKWEQHPVIKLDMSGGRTAENLEQIIAYDLKKIGRAQGVCISDNIPAPLMLCQLIDELHFKTGKAVAVLVDEYDTPLYSSFKNAEEHEKIKEFYRDFFIQLKRNENHLRLCFLTGISRFSNVSIFSLFNNITNISSDPAFATICGVTEDEITEYFSPHVVMLAEKMGTDSASVRKRLKEFYDGYHFSPEKMVDTYNPFSLVNALYSKNIAPYWLSSGGTKAIDSFLNKEIAEDTDWSKLSIDTELLDVVDFASGDIAVLMYQTGYLTIRSVNDGIAYLDFPNTEVKEAFYKALLPYYLQEGSDQCDNLIGNLRRALKEGDIHKSLALIQSLVMNAPYLTKRCAEADYRNLISYILYAAGLRVNMERAMHTGIVDIVAESHKHIFVIELKMADNGGLEAAKRQLQDKEYMAPWATSEKQTVGIAMELCPKGKGILAYEIV